MRKKQQFVYWLTLNSHAPYDARDIQLDVFPCEQFGIDAQSEVCRNFKIHGQFFLELSRFLKISSLQPTSVVIVGDHSPVIFNLEDKEKYLQGNDVLVISSKVK